MTRTERRDLSASTLRALRERTATAEALPPLAIGTPVRANADTAFELRGVVAAVAIAPSGRYTYSVTIGEGAYAGCTYRYAAGALRPLARCTAP